MGPPAEKCGAPGPTCHTHGEGVDPKGNKIAAINVRCIEGVDLDKIEVTPYDGRSL